jgi:hypothetical protein
LASKYLKISASVIAFKLLNTSNSFSAVGVHQFPFEKRSKSQTMLLVENTINGGKTEFKFKEFTQHDAKPILPVRTCSLVKLFAILSVCHIRLKN